MTLFSRLRNPEPQELVPDAQGYLYVLVSPMLKGWCKVGKTTRTPELRAAELSTGLPGRLEVYLECATNDVHEAERFGA